MCGKGGKGGRGFSVGSGWMLRTQGSVGGGERGGWEVLGVISGGWRFGCSRVCVICVLGDIVLVSGSEKGRHIYEYGQLRVDRYKVRASLTMEGLYNRRLNYRGSRLHARPKTPAPKKPRFECHAPACCSLAYITGSSSLDRCFQILRCCPCRQTRSRGLLSPCRLCPSRAIPPVWATAL